MRKLRPSMMPRSIGIASKALTQLESLTLKLSTLCSK